MSLMGREKDVYAIPNLPCIISKECFQNVKLSYLGRMWVLFEFDSLASKEKFLNHSGIGSWFTELIQETSSFENDERIVWISIEGLPIKAWTPNTFHKIASLWGEYMEWEDADLKSLSCKHLCLKTNMKVIINERQKVIIQGKVYWIRVNELDAWFLNFQEDDQDDLSSDGESQEGDVANKADNDESDVDKVSKSSFMHENDTAHKDVNSFKKKSLGNKAKRRWIKELCQKHRINFAFIQETKAESISLHTIKDLWGNQMFDHKVSTCDYFVALMGTWAPTSSKLLIISVYAPQELNERRDLWDYLRTFIDRWEGDTVIMGDFNEVRSEHERFGSTFNRQGAIAFNNFISSACLIDLPLGCYAFTWAHKSASKMSKLDQTTWKSLNIVESNGLIRLKKTLQALKIAIKAWSKEANKRSNDRKINIQQNLSEVDKLIDQGKSNDEILIKRITLLNDLQELNNRNAMEIFQKAKIRWSIEGDENSKYFHGIMNKKRSQLAIRETLANEEWISEQHIVKNEFFTHFKKQFLSIQAPSICFDFTFPTRLSSDKVQDLERIVTYEEVKRAVWDCSTNKSPGPDGFSFEFYRKYWTTIDDDEFQAVRDFFVNGHFPRGSSGLKTNLHKSKLMEIGVSSNVVAAAASLIGCSILTAPFNYLGVKDTNRWYGAGKLWFKMYQLIIDNTILPKTEFPTRWLRVVHIKVNVHAWMACLDKLPTRANLSLRGMDISSIACPLCNSAVESSSHIFFACPLARQV
nr:RNA-directed DNA polymerase, eukaryota [Tanacetum cinerariifolium]